MEHTRAFIALIVLSSLFGGASQLNGQTKAIPMVVIAILFIIILLVGRATDGTMRLQ